MLLRVVLLCSVQGRQLLAVQLNGRSQLSPFYHKKPRIKVRGLLQKQA
jgi:hypothetical protein